MTVKVFKPKKSIFNSPASSATALSNCVQAMLLSLAVATGTKLVMSSGVMITPQAWMPVLRTLPSKTLAVCKVCPSRVGCWLMALSCWIWAKPSLRTFSLRALSSRLNIFFKEMSGTSLAKRSASPKGNSITRAVSRMDDFAAMVP